MTTTRISAAELFSKPHELSPEEQAFLDGLTDEEIERRALADPDAQPLTPEMLRDGEQNRRSRLAFEALRDARLGAKLTEAASDLDLPLFELTDERRQKILVKALECCKVTSPRDPAVRILKLEAVVAKVSAPKSDGMNARSRSPEKHVT